MFAALLCADLKMQRKRYVIQFGSSVAFYAAFHEPKETFQRRVSSLFRSRDVSYCLSLVCRYKISLGERSRRLVVTHRGVQGKLIVIAVSF